MSDEEVWRRYTIDDVAAKLGVSARWLADECRGGRVEHVHMARQRWVTPAQVEALIAKHTRRPEEDRRLDVVRERAARSFRRPKLVKEGERWVVGK